MGPRDAITNAGIGTNGAVVDVDDDDGPPPLCNRLLIHDPDACRLLLDDLSNRGELRPLSPDSAGLSYDEQMEATIPFYSEGINDAINSARANIS
jgi:hypothetical protein